MLSQDEMLWRESIQILLPSVYKGEPKWSTPAPIISYPGKTTQSSSRASTTNGPPETSLQRFGVRGY